MTSKTCLASGSAGDSPGRPHLSLIRLRRDGLPPLRFYGYLIARHEGWVPQARFWHDLALYRSAEMHYVVEISARFTSTAGSSQSAAPGLDVQVARSHTALFETLDGALTLLESHDASADVCPGTFAPALALNAPAVSPAVLMMEVAMLRAFCENARHRYRVGVGELLGGIGLRVI